MTSARFSRNWSGAWTIHSRYKRKPTDGSPWVSKRRRQHSHGQQFTNALDELLDIERLLNELIRASLQQVVDLILVHDAGHDDDLRMLERRVLANGSAHHVAVNVRQHVVQDDQVRLEL